MRGKRLQYGLKHRVTSTIYGCQGDTLHCLATQISSQNSEFDIWDKAQVLVLLSRTRTAKDIIFVGDPKSTMRYLMQKMQTRTLNTDYMERVISLLTDDDHLQDYPTFSYELYPFDFCHIELPQCHTGFVYFLVSLIDNRKIYIGETKDLITRLNQHNSGNGTQFTDDHRPWALYAFISGFDGNKSRMKSIENSWQHLVSNAVSSGVRNPKELVQSGFPLVSNSNAGLKMTLLFK